MAKKYSVFTEDIKTCYFTGAVHGVHWHHIFGKNQYDRKKSEQYGYMLPVVHWLHNMNPFSIHENSAFRLALKQMAQRHFEETHTREEFMLEFGENYIFNEETDGWEINLRELGVPESVLAQAG